MEKTPRVITSLPVPSLERKRISRREALKQITIGTLAGSPLVIGAISHKDIQKVVSDPSQTEDVLYKYKRAAIRGIENIGVEIENTEGNSYEIEQVGKLLDVQLISTHDAYEIADVNNITNYKWDIASANLLKQCYSVLPSHFRRRDESNRPLSIALGTEEQIKTSGVVQIGQYFPGLKDNLMILTKGYFRPDIPQQSLSLLTHENIHYLQDSGRSKLEKVILDKFEFNSIRDFCANINEDIVEYRSNNPSELNEAVGLLRYGAIDVWKDENDDKRIRNNLIEMEAAIGQLYLFGERVFINDLAPIVGLDLAHTFYRYMKNVTFRQLEYASYSQI